MPRSLEEMAAKGARKMQAKSGIMASNWNASKGRCISNYATLPFGSNTKAAHAAGVNAGQYRTPDVAKWTANWKAAVSR